MPTFFVENVTVSVENQLQVGEIVPNFTLISTDLTTKSLYDYDGKKKVISIVPSILEDTVVITVSVDLPFAQARWCGVEGLNDVILLSNYYDNNFGKSFGVLMEEWHLLARAVLVLDADNKIHYTEYLENINLDPDYSTAIEVAKNL